MSTAETSEDQGHSSPQPLWLDKALIQQALRNGGEMNSHVASISVRRAVPPGENYSSTIYRVMATLSDGRERSLIVKGPAIGGLSEVTKESGNFQREIAMLTDHIPKMEALLEKAAPGQFPPLAPRCYHHGSSPVNFIVLEDLMPPGFKIGDRKRGLDLRHCLLAICTLARFHAASHALLKSQPELINMEHTLKSENEGLQDYFKGLLQALAISCRTWPGFEEHAERLEKFKSILGEVFDQVNKPKPGAFNAITHGDFWVNNLMYRYEDGKPEELRTVDLQLSHASSPTTDILHFFSTSLSEVVEVHHKDLLLREYYFELKETLELLGHQAPTIESLLTAMDAHGTYALYFALECPIIKADHNVDIDAIGRGDYSELLRLLELPDIKRLMQRFLQEYARKGWLPA